MLARVKADSRFSTCTAFGGREYVRYEWRQVPADALDEAERRAAGDDYLEFMSSLQAVDASVSPPDTAAVVETKTTTAAPGGKRKGKGK